MASSKKRVKNNVVKRKEDSLLSQLQLFLREFFLQQKRIKPTLLVAYSGGLDSTVLLHALSQLRTAMPMHLRAVYVHHGLSEYADKWGEHCAQTCSNLEIPFNIAHVTIDRTSGLGTEAAARNARYQALQAEKADFICLAHHQDDQAETLLLQLARGAGVKGLAGMAQVVSNKRLLRPFLNQSRGDLLAYAEQHQLQWIEDDSNIDTQYSRNYLRHHVMPVLQQQYPSIRQTLSRSANLMAQADELLTDLALIDAEQVVDKAPQYGALRLAELLQLSQARQMNLLRWWLASNAIAMPSHALLSQVLRQLASTRTDASVQVKVADGLTIRRYQDKVFLVVDIQSMPPIMMQWQGEEVLALPNHTYLRFTKQLGEGIAYERVVNGATLTIRNRVGGERIRQATNQPRRGLKTILQSANIAPWEREQIPLIFINDSLAAIPNITIDVSLKADKDELGLVVEWLPAAL